MSHKPCGLYPGRLLRTLVCKRSLHIGVQKNNSAHQFGACILDGTMELLCVVVGDTTSCAHRPEVLFCVKHSFMQFISLFILQPLCAPLADNRKCRWLAIHIQIRPKKYNIRQQTKKLRYCETYLQPQTVAHLQPHHEHCHPRKHRRCHFIAIVIVILIVILLF